MSFRRGIHARRPENPRRAANSTDIVSSSWQQVREFLNAVTPFGLDLFDTEVKAIERGEVRPFELPPR